MFRSPLLITIALVITISAHAQLTALYSFLPVPSSRSPQATLVSDGTYFYGMTLVGGPGLIGTIYKIKPDGTGYTQLLDFDGAVHGRAPSGGLLFDGTFLYGMTTTGGTSNMGVIFKIMTDGSGYVKLFDFNGAVNGANPAGTLISDGTFLYGMTENGGTSNIGTVFKIKTDGSGFQKLLDFNGTGNGSTPVADLAYDGTFLYGMTKLGGTGNQGTIFRIMPNGTAFLKLKDFTVGINGELPLGSPILIGSALYGMTELGGTTGDGNVFRINTDGSGYTNLTNLSLPIAQDPAGALTYDGTYLYGTSLAGGVEGRGSLFRILLDGTGLVKLADFESATTGVDPSCTPLLLNGLLYGVTPGGGANGFGTLFRFGTPAAVSPTIAGFSPGSGPIGSSVTITGTNFSTTPANNVVMFNGTTAIVTASTSTSITVVVPVGATAGKITVAVAGNTAVSTNDFTPTAVTTTPPPTISTAELSVEVGGTVSVDLVPSISTPNNNLDINSIKVTTQPGSGAVATIVNGVLTIDYTNVVFTGTETITITACDLNDNCSTRDLTINVEGDVFVYNAVSPGGANPILFVKNITLLSDARDNKVTIFDRWQNQVWHGSNYDNSSVVFSGVSDDGRDLPTGSYYYRIEFTSGRKSMTGFISLRQ